MGLGSTSSPPQPLEVQREVGWGRCSRLREAGEARRLAKATPLRSPNLQPGPASPHGRTEAAPARRPVHLGSARGREATPRAARRERARPAPGLPHSQPALTKLRGPGKRKAWRTEPQNVAAHSPQNCVYSGNGLSHGWEIRLPGSSR